MKHRFILIGFTFYLSSMVSAQLQPTAGTSTPNNNPAWSRGGNGQVNVFANDLSTGVYTYSLVADGQVVATKRMMKQ